MAHEGEMKPNSPEVSDRAMEEEDPQDIQELLDIGYDQLDGFVNWLEEHQGQDIRTTQQDCFNAESLIDYLANFPHKEAAGLNEFDLRWFLFSHYIRKIKADPEIEERLPDSLDRFFHFLQADHAASLPDWLPSVLQDREYYRQRRSSYHALSEVDEKEWKEGFRSWCQDLEDDLDARCLWLPNSLGEGLEWGERMGWREATLREEANQIWQQERLEHLMDGLDFDSIREKLGESYLIWLNTPQDRLDGDTPLETIEEERAGLFEGSEGNEEEEEED